MTKDSKLDGSKYSPYLVVAVVAAVAVRVVRGSIMNPSDI